MRDFQDVMMNFVFMVVEQISWGECFFDIFFCFFKEWIIFLIGLVEDYMVSLVIVQLFFFELENLKKEIFMYINLLGGVVLAGLGIYDMMKYICSFVFMICLGMVVFMGLLLLIGGEKDMCFVILNVCIMVYQLFGGFWGQVFDIECYVVDIMKIKCCFNEIYVEYIGCKYEEIEVVLDCDNFMFVEEGKEFGLIDQIVQMCGGEDVVEDQMCLLVWILFDLCYNIVVE